jgi:hypothetical protein
MFPATSFAAATVSTILPADGASVWGLRPFFVVADELTQWHETSRTARVWDGVTTGLAKVRGSRLAVLGTAGDPGHFSYGIRNQALDDPLWRVREVEGPPPLDGPDAFGGGAPQAA